MKKYSNDAPQFFCFQLDFSDETYKIPLPASMTNEEIEAFRATEGDYRKQVEWLRTYMGKDVDRLQPGPTGEIIKDWADAGKEQGASVGES